MFVPGIDQCKRNQRRKKLGLKTVMVMIAADQGRDKNLSLLKVPCYLYGYVSFQLFYEILKKKKTIATFQLRNESLIGTEFTGFEPLCRRGQIRILKFSLFSGFTFRS